jgi:hypothetical protein
VAKLGTIQEVHVQIGCHFRRSNRTGQDHPPIILAGWHRPEHERFLLLFVRVQVRLHLPTCDAQLQGMCRCQFADRLNAQRRE